MAATENDEERNLPFQHRLTVKAAGRVASVKVTLINIRDIFQNFKGPRNKSIAHPNTVLCSCGVAVLITKIQSPRLPSIPTTPHHRVLESFTDSETGKSSLENQAGSFGWAQSESRGHHTCLHFTE